MSNIQFNGNIYDSEEERNSVAFHSYNSLKRNIQNTNEIGIILIIGSLAVVAGLVLSSWLVIVPSLVIYIFLNKRNKEKKLLLLKQYSDLHLNKIVSIEKEYRNTLLNSFRNRYQDSERLMQKYPDLINLIYHKKGIQLRDEDIDIILERSEKENKFANIDKAVKKLKIKLPNDYATVLIVIFSETDFENDDELQEVLDLFEEYQERHDIQIDRNSLTKLITAGYKKRKAAKFEEKLLSITDKSINTLDIQRMNGFEFEDFLEELFSKAGYKVKKTRKSGDQGADLLIFKNGSSIAVQAKRYSGRVGNKAVQEVVAAMKYYDCANGMVVTTGSFTKSAKELAKYNNIELMDGEALDDFINQMW